MVSLLGATKTISSYLDRENEQRLNEMGYTFGAMLGEGQYGAAFRCDSAGIDEHGNASATQLAAKIIKIKYTPDLRYRSPDEVRQLSAFKKLRVRYTMAGREFLETIRWRKVGTSTPEDMIEVPLQPRQELEMKRHVKNIEIELQAIQRCDHINVVKLINMIRFYDEFQNNPFMSTVVLFMELAESDLTHYLADTPHTEQEAQVMCAQIALGLTHLHERGVAHMDLKPENILVFRTGQASQNNILLKISDFGLSILYDPNDQPVGKQMHGTPMYGCPELASQWLQVKFGVRNELHYDPTKCDVWAFGVTLMVILYGKTMISLVYRASRHQTGGSKPDAFMTYLRSKFHTPLLEDLFKNIFVEQQNNRYDIEQVCDHLWLHEACVQCVRAQTPDPP